MEKKIKFRSEIRREKNFHICRKSAEFSQLKTKTKTKSPPKQTNKQTKKTPQTPKIGTVLSESSRQTSLP